MKEKLTPLFPYLIVLGLDFYLLPCFIRDTGSAMALMLLVMPFAAFFCGVVFGMRRGFSLWFPLAAAVLFAPSVPLFYNRTAWVYIPVYGAVVLAGCGLGRIFYRRR